MNTNYVKYLAALLLFGSNGIVASFVLLNSYEIVFLRTLIGSLFLITAFVITKGKLRGPQDKKHLIYLVISGAAMGASWMFLYEGYRQIGVSLATLAYWCGPVIVIALTPLVFKEKWMPVKMFGFLAVLEGSSSPLLPRACSPFYYWGL